MLLKLKSEYFSLVTPLKKYKLVENVTHQDITSCPSLLLYLTLNVNTRVEGHSGVRQHFTGQTKQEPDTEANMASLLSVEEVLHVGEEFLQRYAPRVTTRRVLPKVRREGEDEDDPFEGFDRNFMALDVSHQMIHAALSDLKMAFSDLSNKFAQPLSAEGAAGNSGRAVAGMTRTSKRDVQRYCSVCDKFFASNLNLALHKKKKHARAPDDIVEPEAYCGVCKKQLHRKAYLRIHMSCKHGISSESTRSRCKVRSNRSRSEVSNPAAYCDLCSKQLCNKYYLRTHQIVHHGIASPHLPQENLDNIQKDKAEAAGNSGTVPESSTSEGHNIQYVHYNYLREEDLSATSSGD